MTKKTSDDLVDAGSAYSFPASDPPSFMGGTAVAGSPAENGAHEHVIEELTDPAEAKPAAPHGLDPSGATTEEDIAERVRRRAYEIWETEGYSGNADGHWLRAEQEVRASIQAAEDQQAEAGSRPPSEDAEKMAEQIQVALDARNARSKQTQRAGATGKKPAAKKSGPRKGKSPSST